MIDGMEGLKEVYTQPSAMEPMLPSAERQRLAEKTCDILRKSGALSACVPAIETRNRIAGLVREMNSYYSNLIEGHKTLPRDIERALLQDYSNDPSKRENQLLNRAHIQVEQLMVERLSEEKDLAIHSIGFLSWLHREFYERLPREMQLSRDKSGNSYQILPGQLRTFEVDVGRHQPPHYGALGGFMARFEQFYGNERIIETNQLVALAAAHHRLAWIHPFGDGNGRVTRLYSHAWLVRNKADSLGLWTLSRGLARHRKEYYENLSGADAGRWNDLDGRGNLSDRGLSKFCLFFLDVVIDQIDFMSDLLQLDKLRTRIERYLQFDRLNIASTKRERLMRLLNEALVRGQIERGAVPTILGLHSTEARKIVRLGLDEKLLESASPKGPLSLVFSSKTIEAYFPQLYQDLPAE